MPIGPPRLRSEIIALAVGQQQLKALKRVVHAGGRLALFETFLPP
jgi:hypothetical protein